MILASETTLFFHKIIFYFNIFLTLLITFILLIIGKRITEKLGTTGLRVIERIMGMILMVVAVQFIIEGLSVVIKSFNI